MIKVNFWLNAFLIFLAIVIAIAGIFKREAWIAILYLQFFVGCIQYVGSSIMVFRKHFRKAGIKLHWILSTVFLGGMFLSEYISYFLKNVVGISTDILLILFLAIPWSLAIYYTYVNYRILKSK